MPSQNTKPADYPQAVLQQIARELDLPRHGMELLPLDGTMTPMPR